ncbi:MAG: TM2 domain-containing protein [bacterium]|nr:TM2 domain-containing protein [bacterium]
MLMPSALKYLDPALFSNKLTALLLLFCAFNVAKGTSGKDACNERSAHLLISASVLTELNEVAISQRSRPSPLLHLFRIKRSENRKVTAAILAFPFPFGIVGLHRIYMGTAPFVPVVYIATLGGVFGVLPFIDFWVIVFDKNQDKYLNNEKVFMWVE